MIVIIKAAGQTDRVRVNEGDTVGSLFTDEEFREDYNISNRATPQVNGQSVDMDYVLKPNDTIEPLVAASSKS